MTHQHPTARRLAATALALVLASGPAAAQSHGDHDQPGTPAPSPQANCPRTSGAGGEAGMRQHMAEMRQMMMQMHSEMQAMRDEMKQMHQQMQPRR